MRENQDNERAVSRGNSLPTPHSSLDIPPLLWDAFTSSPQASAVFQMEDGLDQLRCARSLKYVRVHYRLVCSPNLDRIIKIFNKSVNVNVFSIS